MIIALKHDNTTLIGTYENLVDCIFANFDINIDDNGNISVKSKHFESYKEKEIIPTISYNLDEYTKEEAVEHYVRHPMFTKSISRYGIKLYYTQS